MHHFATKDMQIFIFFDKSYFLGTENAQIKLKSPFPTSTTWKKSKFYEIPHFS